MVGHGQTPRLIHRNDMNYTNAVLLESMRMSSIAILALPHFALSDVSIGPYIIPKGTTVLASIVSVLLDPEYFTDPHKFIPERFLDSNGKFKHDEHVIPFGVGKRYCLGQSLAEKEFFLFFTGLMQKFDIESPPGQVPPSYHINDSISVGTVRSAPQFKVLMTSRVN